MKQPSESLTHLPPLLREEGHSQSPAQVRARLSLG